MELDIAQVHHGKETALMAVPLPAFTEEMLKTSQTALFKTAGELPFGNPVQTKQNHEAIKKLECQLLHLRQQFCLEAALEGR